MDRCVRMKLKDEEMVSVTIFGGYKINLFPSLVGIVNRHLLSLHDYLIEIMPENINKLLDKVCPEEVRDQFEALNFFYVDVDVKYEGLGFCLTNWEYMEICNIEFQPHALRKNEVVFSAE